MYRNSRKPESHIGKEGTLPFRFLPRQNCHGRGPLWQIEIANREHVKAADIKGLRKAETAAQGRCRWAVRSRVSPSWRCTASAGRLLHTSPDASASRLGSSSPSSPQQYQSLSNGQGPP